MKTRLALALLVVITVPSIASAQPRVEATTPRLTESEARVFAASAAATANGDMRKFERAFRDAVRVKIPRYEGKAERLWIATDWILAEVMGQVTAFQRNVTEQIRTYKPITDAEWPAGAAVTAFINDEEAPSVGQILVRVDGVMHEATQNHLIAGRVHPKWGALRQRSGWAFFDPNIFAPGAKAIEVILIPEAGDNYVALARQGGRTSAWRD